MSLYFYINVSVAPLRHKSGLVVGKHDSQSKGCGFEPWLIQYTILKWGKSHTRFDFCTQYWFNLNFFFQKIWVVKCGTQTKQKIKKNNVPSMKLELIY